MSEMRSDMVMFFLLTAILLFPMMVDAETEPNDSLDSPEALVDENTDGELNINTTEVDDHENDIFKINIDEGYLVYYSIKKTDTGPGSITIVRYGPDLEPIDDQYLGENELSVPGEVFEDKAVNHGAETERFLVLSDKGTYTIHMKSFDLDDPEEPVDPSSPLSIYDGDRIEGKVYTIEYRGMEFEDSDQYLIDIESQQDVTVTIRRTDGGVGEINAVLYEDAYIRYGADSAVLRQRGQVKELTYEGDYYSDGTLVLEIVGDGEYEIIVDIEDQPEIGGVIMGITAVVMCLVLLLSFSPYIIGAIVLVFLIRYDKKRRKRKQEERNLKEIEGSNGGSPSVYPPPPSHEVHNRKE